MKLLKRIGIGILFPEILKAKETNKPWTRFRYLSFYVLISTNPVLPNFGEMLCIKICC